RQGSRPGGGLGAARLSSRAGKVKDERRRNALHFLCGQPLQSRGAAPPLWREREFPELEGYDRAPFRGEEEQRPTSRGDAAPPRRRPVPARRQGPEPARHGRPAARQDAAPPVLEVNAASSEEGYS